MNLLSRVLVLVCLAVWQLPGVAQGGTDVDAQIQAHRQWVEAHVPRPDTLSREQLLIEAARAICSCCRDDRYVDIIRAAGQRFALQPLQDYAELRRQQGIDVDDQSARTCLRLLADKAGEGSYARAYINLCQMETSTERDEQEQIIQSLYNSAKMLYKRDKTPRSEEIWHLAQFIHTVGGTFYFYAKPLSFEQSRVLMADMVKFYRRTHFASAVGVYAFQHLALFLEATQSYIGYNSYVSRHLMARGDTILNGDFTVASLIGLDAEPQQEMDFWDGAVALQNRLLHPWHPDLVKLKVGVAFRHLFDARLADEIDGQLAFWRAYSGEESVEYASTQLLAKSYKVWNQDFSDTSCDKELAVFRKYCSPSANALLSMLSQAMSLSISGGQLFPAMVLRDEICDIAAVKFVNDPVSRMSYRTMDWFFQKSFVAGHTTAYDELVQEFVDYSESQASFEAIGLGKELLGAAQDMLNDRATALKVQLAILKMAQKLVGKKHPFFINEYVEYGQIASKAYPLEAMTLDGRSGTKALLDDIVRASENCDGPNFGLMVAGDYYRERGDFALTRAFYSQYVKSVESQGAEPFSDDYSTRYYLANAYAALLDACYFDPAMADSIDYYGERLAKFFAQGFDFDPNATSGIFLAVANYDARKGRHGEVETILEQCMAYYDQNPNAMADGVYVTVVESLIQLYGNVYGDMDKCLRLAEKLERNISRVQSYGNDETYIGALRALYDLVEYKNPNDFVLLFRYMSLLNQAIVNYAKTSKNEAVLYNHGLYAITKLVRFANDEPSYRAEAVADGQEAVFDTYFWQPLKASLVDSIMPGMQSMKSQIEQNYPNAYRQSSAYQQLLYNMAVVAHRCQGNIELAEQYYLQFAQCNQERGLLALGIFYLNTDKLSQAVDIFAQIDRKMRENGGLEQMNGGQDANLFGLIFKAYYLAGRYDDAIEPARAYLKGHQEYIKKNFDLFTSSERESFIQRNGSGGTPLEVLLPHRPELAPEVYDAMLQEKGLLLRSSERIRKSILASGNDTLMQAMDSLRMMQAQIEMRAKEGVLSPNQMIAYRDHYDRLERYVIRATAAYRTQEAPVPTWRQVRDCLRQGEACIEYVVTDSALLALVLTPGCDSPRSVPLMKIEQMESLLAKVNQQDAMAVTRDLYEQDTEHLYQHLWQPIEPAMKGASTVYLSPTGFLNAIAFAAIPTPDGKNLIDHYDLRQLTTTAKLVRRDAPATQRPKSARVYGAIYYNEDQQDEFEQWVEHSQSATIDVSLTQRAAINDVFPFLPNTLNECNTITQQLDSCHVRVEQKLGDEPTEQEVRALDGQAPDMLHIATHGFFVKDAKEAAGIPFFSQLGGNITSMSGTGLVMAGGEATWQGTRCEPERDNLLCSYEIASLNLDNTRLVVLSACESGLGAANNEGVFGLQRGFKQAGVRTVCASLWSVNDRSTSQLMQSFYRRWLGGECTMQDAFKAAMLEQRAITPQPYYWAPFILSDADL